jgi:uncharacterized membrane protein YfcA
MWRIVGPLIIGGAIAAPFGGWLVRVLPPRVAMVLVAGVVLCLAVYNVVRLEI